MECGGPIRQVLKVRGMTKIQLWILTTLKHVPGSEMDSSFLNSTKWKFSFNYTKSVFPGPWWWWSSGQRPHLLLWQSEFSSRWHLKFFSEKIVFEKNEKKQKEAWVGSF